MDANYRCLVSICESNGDFSIKNFSSYINNTIDSKDNNIKKASLMALSALLDGP